MEEIKELSKNIVTKPSGSEGVNWKQLSSKDGLTTESEGVLDFLHVAHHGSYQTSVRSVFEEVQRHEVLPVDTLISSRGKVFEKLQEGVILKNWKLINNIPSRAIEWDEEKNEMVLECLVDREPNVYEERVFPFSLFKGFKLEEFQKFLVLIYEREAEMKIEIHSKAGLVKDSDFPKVDFVELFKNSPSLNPKKDNIG